MKKILLYMLMLAILVGCSNTPDVFPDVDQPDENPSEEIEKELAFSLKADATQRNLLEETTLSIHFEEDVAVGQIKTRCDQLEWVVKDNEGRCASYSLMSENHFTFSWGHCFYYPGTFTSSLKGYKEGKVVFESNPVTIQIAADKDFLGWNWNELPDNTDSGKGYVNVLYPDLELTSLTLDEKGKRGIFVYLFNAKGEEEASFYERSVRKLYDYMVRIYGSPVLSGGGEAVQEAYRRKFSHQPPEAQPLAIWKTTQSRMVLLNVSREGKSAQVFAEPAQDGNSF